MANSDLFHCDECNHSEDSGFCRKFGLRRDEINGEYRDESRGSGKHKVSNDDLRKTHGIHIPREGTKIDSSAIHLKDYIFNNRCTEYKDDQENREL